MKRKSLLLRGSISFFVVFALGCHQEVTTPASVKVGSNDLKAAIYYDWNWNVTGDDYMQTPGGAVLRPWASGTSSNLPTAQVDRLDINAADGWRLLYNTFTTDPTKFNGQDHPFFALYNQYRGLVRFYYYNPPANNQYSNYITERLQVNTGQTTSFLNFSNSEIVDPANNALDVTRVYNDQLNAQNWWFVSQYEIGYDPTLASMSYTNMAMYSTVTYYDIGEIDLSGTLIGTATGTMSTNTSSLSSIFTIAKDVGTVAADIVSTSDPLFAVVTPALKAVVSNVGSKGALATISDVASLASQVTADGSQKIDLKIQLNAQLNGTLTQEGNTSNTLGIYFPGLKDASSAIGPTPGGQPDGQPLGVFNLPVRPVVNVKNVQISGAGYNYSASLDPSTLAFLTPTNSQSFCPCVVGSSTIPAIATIQNLKYDILTTIPDPYNTVTWETIGGLNYHKINTEASSYNPVDGNIVVRIYFDVVPVNGAKTATIVKTFIADVNSTVRTAPPCRGCTQ